MGKLFWMILLPIFFAGGDCRIKTNGKSVTEDISDEGEKCSGRMSSFLDSSSGYMQSLMEGGIFASHNFVTPKFMCFSSENDQDPSYVTNTNFNEWDADECGFDPTVKTVFIIQGYKEVNADWTREMKDALILRESCNVFIVECSEPTEKYSDNFKNIPEIGKQVALFIRNLMKSNGLMLPRVHIIGYSTGAQAAGFAAKEIKKTEKMLVGRITGLDPAGPGFYRTALEQRLDRTDASFVDIIHTESGCNRLESSGNLDAVGHFDFYPNGGRTQPGCLTTAQYLASIDPARSITMLQYLFGEVERKERRKFTHLLCSHARSHMYFKASILNEGCQFRSVQCSSWERYASGQCDGNKEVAMGYYADRYRNYAEDGAKKFYLSTSDHPPYC